MLGQIKRTGFKFLWAYMTVSFGFIFAGIAGWLLTRLATAVLSAVGLPSVVVRSVTVLLWAAVFGFVVLVVWPPWLTDVDLRARKNDFGLDSTPVEAAQAIQMLEGVDFVDDSFHLRLVYPTVTSGYGSSIAAAVAGSTASPAGRTAVLDALDVGPTEVFRRLCALYDHLSSPPVLWLAAEKLGVPFEPSFVPGAARFDRNLMSAIERFGRLDPEVAEPHLAVLFEMLSLSDDHAILHAGLTLAHLSRDAPEVAPDCTERVVFLLESKSGDDDGSRDDGESGDDDENKSGGDEWVVGATIALAELAAHDATAAETLVELTDSDVSAARAIARDAVLHYANSDDPRTDPYPAGQILDEYEQSAAESDAEAGQQHLEEQIAKRLSSGEEFEPLSGGEVCESCGAVLLDHWDGDSTAGALSCGSCGHTLDGQSGAGDTYRVH